MIPNEPETLEDLRSYVNRDDNKGRMKFMVKILIIMKYTLNHPETIEETGAAWCSDKIHFIVNSNKLANFMNLRPNSINTNFRDHGFIIVSSLASDLGKDFPGIALTRHWKKRYISNPPFTANTTITEAEAIPCIQVRIDTQERLENKKSENFLPFIPKETNIFLKGDQGQLLNLSQLNFALMTKDDEDGSNWFKRLLKNLTEYWKLNVSGEASSGIQHLISVIIDKSQLSPMNKGQISANIEFLLHMRDDSSQISDTITFDTFVKYFVRYGSINDPIGILHEVTYYGEHIEPFLMGFSSFESQSQPDVRIQFKNWFSPFADKEAAKKLLNQQVGECWVVIPSKTPNMFTLVLKSILNNKYDLSYLRITYDAITEDASKRFYVPNKDGELIFASSFHNMLIDTLGLSYPEMAQCHEYEKEKPNYVTADDILQRRKQSVPISIDDMPSQIPGSQIELCGNEFEVRESQMITESQFTQFTFSQLDSSDNMFKYP